MKRRIAPRKPLSHEADVRQKLCALKWRRRNKTIVRIHAAFARIMDKLPNV